MERFNKKIYSGIPLTVFCLILIAILSLFSFSSAIAEVNGLTNMSMKDFVSPKYSETTKKLQYILTGKRAQTVGAFLKITDARIDVIGKYGKKVTSIVTTPEAFYNQETQIIKGDKPIHYQSLGTVIDGVGFDCNMKTQLLHIRNNVKMLITSVEHLQDDEAEADKQKDAASDENKTPHTDADKQNGAALDGPDKSKADQKKILYFM